MTPGKNIKTGRKDAKGRPILRGPMGGFFVITAAGNRIKPATKMSFMPLNKQLTNHIQRR